MFENLINDVTNSVMEKIALRSHPDSLFNKADADKRALMFLSTDREGYTNAMRNSDNMVLGCNNDKRAKLMALQYLKEQVKPAVKAKEFQYVDSLLRSLA